MLTNELDAIRRNSMISVAFLPRAHHQSLIMRKSQISQAEGPSATY